MRQLTCAVSCTSESRPGGDSLIERDIRRKTRWIVIRNAGPWLVLLFFVALLAVIVLVPSQTAFAAGGRAHYQVAAPAPTVTSINPREGYNTGPVDVSVGGTNFVTGCQVYLRRTGYITIVGTGITLVSATQVDCTFDIEGAAAGVWNVRVTNPNGRSGTLNAAFTVKAVPRYQVSASVWSGSGSVSPGSQTVLEGDTASMTITPGAHYRLESIIDNGVSMPLTTRYVIVDVRANHAVLVTFESIPLRTCYLAEGSTDHNFSTYISIQNPNASTVEVNITFMPTGYSPVYETLSLPPQSQTTLNNQYLLKVLEGPRDFSTRIETVDTDAEIAVDRTMYWPYVAGPYVAEEAHSANAVTAPSNSWFLPEGSSNWGFECWLLLQNPNGDDTNCQVAYMTEDQGPVTVNHLVPAHSRATFSMEQDIGRHDSSIMVSSDLPVIAERAMYRNDRREGSCSTGATSPATDFYLTEGTTAWGFTTYILVQNPQPIDNTVSITYMTPGGPAFQAPFVMPANSRRTVRVNDVLPNSDESARVEGSLPLIAERSMYWDNGTGEASHDSVGMDSPHKTFYLPDGETTGGRQTWTLAQNPNDSDVWVDITYMTPDGTGNVTRSELIPANSRRSFNMQEHSGILGRAAIMVDCTTPDAKITVERSMYWNNRGTGTNTIGAWSD